MPSTTPAQANSAEHTKVPNFITTPDGRSLAVGCFSDEVLREMAEAWTEDLLAKAARQRANVNREYERVQRMLP